MGIVRAGMACLGWEDGIMDYTRSGVCEDGILGSMVPYIVDVFWIC